MSAHLMDCSVYSTPVRKTCVPTELSSMEEIHAMPYAAQGSTNASQARITSTATTQLTNGLTMPRCLLISRTTVASNIGIK